MSLIIAKIIENKIYIESDTKITGNDVVRNNPINGRLKAFILDPRLVMCFAGVLELGEDAFRHFKKEAQNTIRWIDYITYLCELTAIEKGSVEFILAGYENNVPFIIRISEGIKENFQQSWIGDRQAFSSFQKQFQNEISSEKRTELAFGNAFRKTLENAESDFVGDFQISITSNVYTDNNTGEKVTILEYNQKCEMISDRPVTLKNLKEDSWNNFPPGSSFEGSYAICHFTALPPYLSCLGLHFGYADFGIFYHPQFLIEPIYYRNVNAKQFVDNVFVDHKIKLQGFEVLTDSFGVRLIEGNSSGTE